MSEKCETFSDVSAYQMNGLNIFACIQINNNVSRSKIGFVDLVEATTFTERKTIEIA